MAGADRFRGGTAPGRAASASGGRRPGPALAGGTIAPGERLAAISGVALVLFMLFDWFGGSNAWQLKLMDLVLFAIAVVAVGVAVLGATGRGRFEAAGLALTVAGGVAVGTMLTLVLESSGGTVPLVLGLLATVGILGGGLVELSRLR